VKFVRSGRLGVVSSLAFLATLTGQSGCGEPEENPISIGVLLSYSGYLAANSTNSERALQMAIEAANAAGGIGPVGAGQPPARPVRIVARDTRSDATRIAKSARELVDADVALFVGPDSVELVVTLVSMLRGYTMMLPSYATAHLPQSRPPWWFVMGAGTARVACELAAQLRADNRTKPLVLVESSGYNSLLGWELTRTYGIPQLLLPTNQPSNKATVQPITAWAADSYVLAALPSSASSLVFSMAAIGALGQPSQWYLSPTLHTPALLETIPKGALAGAHGVAPGTVAGATDFRAHFVARWHDEPLDDAYPFYDAGAVAVLALERAMIREGVVPKGGGLGQHVMAVTNPGGIPVRWNEIAHGMELLRQGQEVEYVGLSGPLEFDLTGQTSGANANWWTIGPAGFETIPNLSDCRSGPR
jgi:branched-chain amino acid transport system substrate-binding protein